MADLRVLVVGAGIAGLAVARALHRRGVAADVVERATDWSPGGAGLFLPANAVRALGQLGIGDALAARANPIRRQRIHDHRGRLLADIPVSAFWNGVGACVAIHRADLHEILRGADTAVRLGTTVVSLRDADAPVARFSDGSTGAYDLVVGADGIRSTVRDIVLGGPPARPVGQVCWRFVVDGSPDINDWTARLGPGRSFLTVALGRGRVYCYADVGTDQLHIGPRDDWRRLFADFVEPVPSLLRHGEDAHRATIEEVAPPAWAAHRVVLVGDAAHASSPNMAQGAAMAVEDAVVLADLLASGRDLDQVVETYERRRAPRVAWVQDQTHRRDRTRSLPPMVRNLTLRAAATRIFTAGYRPLRDPP